MRQLAHWLWRLRRKRSEKRVRKKGLEPLRPFGHQLLRLARLPIPPLPQRSRIITSRQNSQAEEGAKEALTGVSVVSFALAAREGFLLVSAAHGQPVVTSRREELHATLHKMRDGSCG